MSNIHLHYGNATKEQLEIVERFIAREIHCNQSYLVEELLKKEIFSYDDVINLYSTRCKNHEAKEIFEWYAVSKWLATQLDKLGEPYH